MVWMSFDITSAECRYETSYPPSPPILSRAWMVAPLSVRWILLISTCFVVLTFWSDRFFFSPLFDCRQKKETWCIFIDQSNDWRTIYSLWSMIKTVLTNQSNPPFVSSSSSSGEGSVGESDPSSYRSLNDTSDDRQPDQSTGTLLDLIDKLKRELTAVKQAKTQLATLYKVSERGRRRSYANKN